MKIAVLIFSICVLTSCCANKKTGQSESLLVDKTEIKETDFMQDDTQELPIAIYDSHTRGSHFTVTVYNSYITVVKEYKGKPLKLEVTSDEIANLKNIISELSLKDISTYEAPTQKRFYDGAPIASISVFSNDEKFSSKPFDGGFPPKPLADLVNKVLSLSAEK